MPMNPITPYPFILYPPILYPGASPRPPHPERHPEGNLP